MPQQEKRMNIAAAKHAVKDVVATFDEIPVELLELIGLQLLAAGAVTAYACFRATNRATREACPMSAVASLRQRAALRKLLWSAAPLAEADQRAIVRQTDPIREYNVMRIIRSVDTYGRSGIMRMLKTQAGCDDIEHSRLTELIFRFGDYPLLEEALQCFLIDRQELAKYTNIAAEYGHLGFLEQLYRQKLITKFSRSYIVLGAARAGQLSVLNWAIDVLDASLETDVLWLLATSADSTVLDWLVATCAIEPGEISLADRTAFEFSDLDATDTPRLTAQQRVIFSWLSAERFPFPLDLERIASRGQRAVLKYLVARHFADLNESAVRGAAKAGQLALLRWLRGQMPEKHFRHCSMYAAANGRLDVCKWLDDSFELDASELNEIAVQAAMHGHIALFEWSVSESRNKIGWKIEHFAVARSEEQLAVLDLFLAAGFTKQDFVQEFCRHCCTSRGGPLILDWLVEKAQYTEADADTEQRAADRAYRELYGNSSDSDEYYYCYGDYLP